MLGSSEFHGGSCPSPLPQCPEGYILVEGDSWGEALSTASDQDIKSCAALCTDLPGECCSFEWSPTERQCNLNRECAPSHEKFQDYLFCVKGAFKHNLLTNNWRKHRLHVSRLDPQRTISSRLFVRKGCLRGPRTDLNWWFFLLSIKFLLYQKANTHYLQLRGVAVLSLWLQRKLLFDIIEESVFPQEIPQLLLVVNVAAARYQVLSFTKL